MTNDKLIQAYHAATRDYEAAKAGAGNRLEAFTRFLVAERRYCQLAPARTGIRQFSVVTTPAGLPISADLLHVGRE
jgi:hypothetical protein